jgi:hypothetical protein
MDAGSTLETIAEIGISLAGFAGIIGALAGERLRPSHPGVWLPFWAMIASSLGILFAALFPVLPYQLGAPSHVCWGVSSAFVTLLTACNLVVFMPRIRHAQRDGVLYRIPAFEVPMNLSAFLILVSQVLNTLGVGLPRSAGGFLIGLYLLVLIAALNFVFLLYVLGCAPGVLPAQQGAPAAAAPLHPANP